MLTTHVRGYPYRVKYRNDLPWVAVLANSRKELLLANTELLLLIRANKRKNVYRLSLARVASGVCSVRGHIPTRHNRQSSKGGPEFY